MLKRLQVKGFKIDFIMMSNPFTDLFKRIQNLKENIEGKMENLN